jgi:hypothetical protein
MDAVKKKKKIKITFKLGFRESLGVLFCSIIFLFGPIAISEYIKISNTPIDETYTQAVFDQRYSQDGQVAGVSTDERYEDFTTEQLDSKYYKIPLINFNFDTTLSDTATIVFLLGTLIMIGAIIFAVTIMIDSSRQMVIKTN